VLVATVPTTPIVIGVGALLVGAGLLLWAWLGRGGRPPTGLLVLAVLSGLLAFVLPSPCEFESPYFCAWVEPDPSRATGRTLWLDRVRNSYVDLADPTHLEFTYTQIIGDVIATVVPEGAGGAGGHRLEALHIGGGGFTLPRYLAAVRPGSFSRVLELDPTIVRIARTELGLKTGPELQVRIGDARISLAAEPAGRYDLVIGDAFSGVVVPWHLVTVEFVEEIRRAMTPDGIYVLNLIDHPPLAFARAEVATLRREFAHVAVIAPPALFAEAAGGNIVVVASSAPFDAGAIQARNHARGDDDLVVSNDTALDAFVTSAPVLTDDYAPVDQLLAT
jgi:spermidine synthase